MVIVLDPFVFFFAGVLRGEGQSSILQTLILIHWIVIYLVDSAIQCLKNRGQKKTKLVTKHDLFIFISRVHAVMHLVDKPLAVACQ